MNKKEVKSCIVFLVIVAVVFACAWFHNLIALGSLIVGLFCGTFIGLKKIKSYANRIQSKVKQLETKNGNNF